MEEIANDKEGDVKTTSISKGKSCKGCLYFSSVLKSNSLHPRCIGLTRSVQVQGYFVGKSELAATKEGRSLTDFKYGCLGYSVYLDDQKASEDTPGQKVELPVCVGVENEACTLQLIKHDHTVTTAASSVTCCAFG
ncbi:hypothetical protein QQ045_020946 [Rhodiola kirilowii]